LRQHTIAGEASNMISLTMFDIPWTDSGMPEWIDVLAHWSPHPVQQPTLRFALQDYPALKIMERDRQALIKDVITDSRLDSRSRRALLKGFKARTVLAMPLIAGGQWIGHVNVMYPEPRDFTEAELQQLRNLVGQAAVAVQSINLLDETSRLLEGEQRQRRISDALVRATSRMLGVTDERKIRRVIVEEIENLIGPDQITLYNWYRETDTMQVEVRNIVRGARHDDYGDEHVIDGDLRPDLWRVLRLGEAALSQMDGNDDFVHEHYILPWQVGTEVAGVIEIYHTTRGTAIRQEDQASIEGIVQQAAIRLQNARLFEETQQRTAETEALYRVSRRINTAENYLEILEALRQHTFLGSNALSVRLNYFDRPWVNDDLPEWVQVLAHWSELPDSTEDPRTVSRYALQQFAAAPQILEAEEATMVRDVATDSRLDEQWREHLQRMGAASAIFVPLLVGGQWLGFIDAFYRQTTEFPEAEVRQLKALAAQAATATHGLYLLEQAQARAQRERVLREITERVRSVTDVDVIMKTAVREVSRALGRDAYVMLGEQSDSRENGKGQSG